MAQNTVSVIVKGIDRVSHILKDLEDQLKSFRDFPIDLDVGADVSRARRAIANLADQDINVDVHANTAVARAEIESLRLIKDIHIPVEADTAQARAEIATLRAVKDIDIDVDAHTAAARAQIAALYAVKDIELDVDAHTARARAEIEALRLVKDIEIDVDVHTKKAMADIITLKKALPKVHDMNVRLDTAKAMAEAIALEKALPRTHEIKVELDASVSKLQAQTKSVLERLPDRHMINLYLKANQTRMAASIESMKRNLPNEHFLNVRVDENSASVAKDVKALIASLPDKHTIEVEVKSVQKAVAQAEAIAQAVDAIIPDTEKMVVDIDVNTDSVKKAQTQVEKLEEGLEFARFMANDLFPDNNEIFMTELRNIKDLETQLQSVKQKMEEANHTDMSESLKKAVGEVENIDRKFVKLKQNFQVISSMPLRVNLDIDTDSVDRSATAARDHADNVFRRGNGMPLKLDLQFFARQAQEAQSMLGKVSDFAGKLPNVSGFLMILPAVIPGIAAVTAAIGGLTASIAAATGAITVMTGGFIAGFAAAGIGIAGFAAIAIPQIANIFKKTEEIATLEEKIANASSYEEKCRLLEEMAKLQGGLNDKQREGVKALQDYQVFWKEFSKPFEMHSINIFVAALELLQKVLTAFKPAFMATAHAVEGLMGSLNESMKTPEFKKFTDFINTTAGPAVKIFGEAFGFAIQGIMNLIVAFGPLAMEMMESFRGMMERFAEWSASLSESKGFEDFVNFAMNEGMTALKQLGDIFGNVFSGISGIISAFMPYAEDLTGTFVDLSEKFANWGQTLDSNPQFAEFIKYAQEKLPQVLSLIGSLATFIVNLGVAFAPIGGFILGVITAGLDFANWLMDINPKVSSVIATLGWFVLAIGPVLGVLTSVAGMFMKFGSTIKTMWNIVRPIFPLLLNIIKLAFSGIMTVVRVAVMALFSPAGLIIAAIVVLAILIYKYWDEIKAFLAKTWEWIKKAAVAVWDALKLYFTTVLNIYKTIFTAVWNAIKTVLTTVWNGLKTAAIAIWDAIKLYFTTVLNIYKTIFTTIWNAIKTVLTTVWNTIKTVAIAVWDAIKAYFTTVLNIYKTIFTTIWNTIKTVLTTIWNAIKGVASTVWNAIKAIFTNVVGGIKTTVIGAFDTIKSRLEGIWNGLKETAKSAWGGVADIIKGAINGIIKGINAFTGAISAIKISIPKVSIPGTDISIGGGSIGMPNIPKIPMLAKGGIVTNATAAVIGEGRYDEAVLPLSKNTFSKLAEGINGQGAGSGITVNQTFNTQVDADTIRRATERAIRKQSLNWGAQ